jgi:hypothetical protein
MLIILGSVLVIVASFLIIGMFISAPSHSGPSSDHFDGKKFINPGNAQAKGLTDVFQWMMQRKQGPWTEKTESAYGEKPEAFIREGVKITFVNHSTFLIQMNGVNPY